MGSIGHLEKLSWDRLGMHSATISVVGGSCVSLLLVFGSDTAAAQKSNELRSPSEFSGIQDPQTRSRALFTEAAKVIMNPRCTNCHPATDSPRQVNDRHIHMPPITRGDSGGGMAESAAPVTWSATSRLWRKPATKAFRGIPAGASLPLKWPGRESRWVKSAHNSRIPAAMAGAT